MVPVTLAVAARIVYLRGAEDWPGWLKAYWGNFTGLVIYWGIAVAAIAAACAIVAFSFFLGLWFVSHFGWVGVVVLLCVCKRASESDK
jgi:hypothetical protein